jgi:TolA-binding protein
MKGGDQITVVYEDRETSESSEPVAREVTARALAATTASVRVVDAEGRPVETVSPGDVLRVSVADPDAVQTGTETCTVAVESSGGHAATLKLAVQEDAVDSGVFREAETLQVTLGGPDSPETAGLREGSWGGSVRQESVGVLNVMGNDTITVTYTDAATAGGEENVPRSCTVGVASLGVLEIKEPTGAESIETVKPGDRLSIEVADGDRDLSAKRDSVEVTVTAASGDVVRLRPRETLPHSGLFRSVVRAALGGVDLEDDVLTVVLGDRVEAVYVDPKSPGSSEPVKHTTAVDVISGADAEVSVFSKSLLEDELAAETFIKLAESYYRVAVRRLKTEEIAPAEIPELRRALDLATRVSHRWPDSENAVAARLIGGNVHRSVGRYAEAIAAFEEVATAVARVQRAAAQLEAPPEGEADGEEESKADAMAAYALYQIGVAYFDMGEVDEASRAWARLIFRYPNSSLVPKAVLRKGEAFYKDKDYERAAQVFEKFVEYHPSHVLVDKVMYKSGVCHYLTKDYRRAGEVFSELLTEYPGSGYAGDAQYWLGESLYHSGQRKKALVEFQRVINDYPSCQWRQQAQLRIIELE